MNTTLSKHPESNMTNRKLVAILITVVVAAVAGGYALKSTNDRVVQSAADKKLPFANAARKEAMSIASGARPTNASPQIPALQRPTRADITYRPGEARAFRQYTGPIDKKSTTSYWWLYAQTEEEAKWLDYYGYPTPAEEAKLRASTEIELKLLADAGDLNAQAHYLSRLMSQAVFSENFREMMALGGLSNRLYFGELYASGSSYQATTFMQAYANVLANYNAIPPAQQTEQQRKLIAEWAVTFNESQIQTQVFADGDAEKLAKEIVEKAPGFVRQAMTSSLSSMDTGSVLSYAARHREELGLPPLTSKPRPKAPEGDSPIYLERY